MPSLKTVARFIEPMLLTPARMLPEGRNWTLELKLDGYRALAIKSGRRVQLRSRNNKDFSARYPAVAKALAALPDETVVDGEVLALEGDGRPSFNALQNVGGAQGHIVYYVFDVLVLEGRDVMSEQLATRRALLHEEVLPHLSEPVRESPVLDASLTDLIAAVAARGWKDWWQSAWTAAMSPVSARAPGKRCESTAARSL